jgi:hypothetical protein
MISGMISRMMWSIGIFLVSSTLYVMPALAESPALIDSPQEGNVLVLPYVAVGGTPEGWHFQTMLILENPQDSLNSGTVEFFSNDGQPLEVQLNDASELAAETDWMVLPGRSKVLILTHPGGDFHAGWLRVKRPEKSAVQITVVIQFYNGDYLAGQAGIQAGGPEEENASFYYSAAFKPSGPLGSRRFLPRWRLRDYVYP